MFMCVFVPPTEVPIITTPIISGVVGGGGKRRRKRANTTPGVKCEFGVRDNPLVPKGKEAKYEMQWVVNGQRKPAFELDKGQRSAQIQCGEQGYKIGDQVIFLLSPSFSLELLSVRERFGDEIS